MSLAIDNKVFISAFNSFTAARSEGKAYFRVNEDRSLTVVPLKSQSSKIQDVLSVINEIAQKALLSHDLSGQDIEKMSEAVTIMKSSFEGKQARFWVWLRNFFIGDKINLVRTLFERFTSFANTFNQLHIQAEGFHSPRVSLTSASNVHFDSEYSSDSATSGDFSTGRSSPFSQDDIQDDQGDFLSPEFKPIESSPTCYSHILENMDKLLNKNFIGPFHIDATEGLDLENSVTYKALSTSSLPSVDDIKALACYPNLKTLSFIDLHLDFDHFLALAELTNLQELFFFNCDGFSAKSIEALSKLEQLTHITFYSCTSFDKEAGQSLSSLTTLHSIVLKDCSPINECSFDGFDKLRNLAHFKISYEKLSQEGIERLSRLETLKHFTLFVKGSLDESDIYKIKLLKNVTELDFDKSNTTSKSLLDDQLSALTCLESIKSLKLRFNGSLTDACVEAIRSFGALEALDIHGTSISEEGILRFSSLKNLKELRIGKRFGVKEPKLTSSIFTALSSLDQLSALQIINTDITLDEARSFKEAHPHIQVTEYFIV